VELTMRTEEEAREIKRRHSPILLREPGVCGVGAEKDERGEYCIALHLDTDDAEVLERLPTEIEGYPVKLIHSGPFRKLSAG